MLHAKDLRNARNCESCHAAPATVPMFPVSGDTTKAVMMCEDCAWTAFEHLTHESDLNEPTTDSAHA